MQVYAVAHTSGLLTGRISDVDTRLAQIEQSLFTLERSHGSQVRFYKLGVFRDFRGGVLDTLTTQNP